MILNHYNNIRRGPLEYTPSPKGRTISSVNPSPTRVCSIIMPVCGSFRARNKEARSAPTRERMSWNTVSKRVSSSLRDSIPRAIWSSSSA